MEFSKVEIIVSVSKASELVTSLGKKSLHQKLSKLGVNGITVSNVLGCGVQNGAYEYEINFSDDKPLQLLPKSMIMFVCKKESVDELLAIVSEELYTGHIGDGKIFVSDVTNIIRVRTGEQGMDALQKTEL